MKKAIKKLCLIMAAIMCLAILPCQVNAEDAAKPKIFVIGDSMAASYEEAKYPRMGWGQALSSFFTDEVEVVNCAVAGTSSRSFYYDYWKSGVTGSVLDQIGEGDYLLFTFGANDTKNDNTNYDEDGNLTVATYRKTNPALGSDVAIPAENGATPDGNPTYSFKAFMKAYITETIGKGATPIMLTQPERGDNRSSNYQFAVPTMAEYTTAITELADELNKDESIKDKFLCLKDITPNTLALYKEYGETNYKKLFCCFAAGKYNTDYWGENAVADTTHFRDFGAAEVAGIIVEELIENNSDLTQYLRTVTKPVVYDSDHNTAGTAIKMTEKRTVNTTIYPRAQFINKEESDVTIKSVVAGYDVDGKLTNISVQDEITVPGKSVVSFDSPYTMPAEPHAGKIRMFVWDFESLIPVGEEVNEETFKKTDTMPNMYFAEDFEDYRIGSAIDGQGGWEAKDNMYVIDTWNGSNAMSIPAGGGTARQVASKEFDRITIGPNAAADMETVIECDVNMGLYTYLKIRCDGNSVLEVGYQNNRLYHYGYNPPTADESGTVTTGATANVGNRNYTPNNDAHLKIVINEKECIANIYVDGTLVFEEQPIYAWIKSTTLGTPTYTYINKILISNKPTAGTAKVDNLMVYRQKIAE